MSIAPTVVLLTVGCFLPGCMVFARTGVGERTYPGPATAALESAPTPDRVQVHPVSGTVPVALCRPELAAPGPHQTRWVDGALAGWRAVEAEELEPSAQQAMAAALTAAGVEVMLLPDHCDAAPPEGIAYLRWSIVRFEERRMREALDAPEHVAIAIAIETDAGLAVRRHAGAARAMAGQEAHAFAAAVASAGNDMLVGLGMRPVRPEEAR